MRAGQFNVMLLLAGGMLAASCQGRDARPAAAESRAPSAGAAVPATPSSAPATLAAGTPAGGLQDWIGDVRRGLEAVTARAAANPAQASRSALDLYLTRQEYIEMYWGAAGRLSRGAELGPAVKEAETRFHLLLSRFQPGKPVDPAVLRHDVRSLSDQYDRVLELAHRSGALLDPHAATASASGARGAR